MNSNEEIPDSTKCTITFLGNSGLKVSNICLGALTFGENAVLNFPGQLTEADSHKMLNRFVEWGGNFIDTADIYGCGESESIVGRWLSSQERDRYVVATKAFFPMDQKNVNVAGLSRRNLTMALDQSLKRLSTDYIDLYQPHVWDIGTPVKEVLRTLNDLVRIGKVRYLGFCNVMGWQLQKMLDLQEQLGLEPIISLQQQYSLLDRWSELEPFEVCKANRVGVLPWSPLKGGILTGKVQRDKTPDSGRLGWAAKTGTDLPNASPFSKFQSDDQLWAIVDTVKRIASNHGRTPAQVSIRWLLQKEIVPSVIIGARTLQQLDDNMAAANGWELTAKEMEELDTVSSPGVPYPYSFIRRFGSDGRYNPFNPPAYVMTSSAAESYKLLQTPSPTAS